MVREIADMVYFPTSWRFYYLVVIIDYFFLVILKMFSLLLGVSVAPNVTYYVEI